MATIDRQRRHDERWQHEVLDGLARMLAVLHDISDGLRQVTESVERLQPSAAPAPATEDRPRLLSVDDLAEVLGVSASTVRGIRASGNAPTATKVGGRLFFQPDDVDAWLAEQRENRGDTTKPWRQAFLPGRIGSGLPRSSEPEKRAWCTGSHTEPLAASKWTGRAVCRVCNDDVMVNRNGLLRKHYPRWW